MPFKTLTIKKSTYDKLKSLKKKKESFSEFFDRSFNNSNPDIMEYAGSLKMSEKEYAKVKKRMSDWRSGLDEDFERRLRNVKSRL